LNEAGPECLPVESLIPPAVVTPRGQFPRAIDAPSGVLWGTLNPDDDFEDNSINGTKLQLNTVTANRLVPGTNGNILTTVAGVPVWAAPPAVNTVKVTANISVPTGITYGTGITINTTALGGQPDSVQIVAVCKVPVNGYIVGNVLANIGYHFTGGYIIAGGLPMAIENAQPFFVFPELKANEVLAKAPYAYS
jgi:rhodanese-related sulfurtransferase